MRAIILAGGKGARMAAVSRTTPKALLPVAGKPVIEYQIDVLRRSRICDITVVIGHLGETIRDRLGDGQRLGVKIGYFEETTPLGTGGALAELKGQLHESFIVMYGDLVLDMDVVPLIRFHRLRRAICTLTVHANTHPDDSDVVVLNRSAVVERFLYKNQPRSGYYRNLVNAGILACEPELLSFANGPGALDLERDIVGPALSSGRVYGYQTAEYIQDMGTEHRYACVQADAAGGVIAARMSR